ncbi:MAG: DUF1540 domain-containing protein [Ruminococcaceae bacterium]|nr:DUF1540 domain-containing protein [Oscillospiraceae bacterium]
MTKLQCDAIHCISNRDGCCCRPNIQVGGSQATEYQQTCCESFRPIEGNATNAMDFSHVNKQMPIRCEATKCVYNKECQCVADAVRVAGSSAHKADQTACETFECNGGCCGK